MGRGRAADQLEGTDAGLVARAQRGEAAAFEQLYLSHRHQVYTLCLNLCGDPEQAQDLLQETFVRAYRALRAFRAEAQFSTWLHRIAVNLCRDQARRRDGEPLKAPPHGRRASPPPEVDLRALEQVEQVRATLVKLRAPHREVLALRYSQGLSYREIAELLGWSLSRVKVTIHRAKRAFKDIYREAGGDDEV